MTDRTAAARRAAFTRSLQRGCPWCGVPSGVRHLPECGPGYVNFSDDRGRYYPPPTRRLARWHDCGPTAEACAVMPVPTSAAGAHDAPPHFDTPPKGTTRPAARTQCAAMLRR